MSKARRRWQELMRLLSVDSTWSRRYWRILESSYRHSGRHYHTLRHIGQFLDALHRYGEGFDPALEVAAFFHDVIYDPKGADNESLSAELACQFLKDVGLVDELGSEVVSLILATGHHQESKGDNHSGSDLFLDCDLLILGASAKSYNNYSLNVRKEYAHCSDAEYRKARAQVLERFLERKQIFLTSSIHDAFESRARRNLERELKQLRGPREDTGVSRGCADISGSWHGVLGDTGLTIAFHLSNHDGIWSGTVDSPMQDVYGMRFDELHVSPAGVRAEIKRKGGLLEARLSEEGDLLIGSWRQRGVSLAITARRGAFIPPNRPQTPSRPFSYMEEAVLFASGDLSIAGTLTRPAASAPSPAVVLVHGSGPHGRDEVIYFHRPFMLLADYLTSHGVVVLRYDKRGIGDSSGDYHQATTVDFARDALSAVEFLKRHPAVDPTRIGVIGHSEGGTIAPMVATWSTDVSFIVLMAGSVLPGDEILIGQVAQLDKAQGLSDSQVEQAITLARKKYEVVKSEPDNTLAAAKIRALHYGSEVAISESDPGVEAGIQALISPWYRFFISYDPRQTMKGVRCRILAINGDKDMQVLADENLAAIAVAQQEAGNSNAVLLKLPNLNHLFQTCKTGLPAEYGQIEETIAPIALKTIGDWVLKQ